MNGLRQREPRYLNRRLLDLAHLVNVCMNCGMYADPGCEPAHENGIEAGKGQSTKSHDNRHAALCHKCHAWLDSGIGADPSGYYPETRDGKEEMWTRAHKRTFDHYWRNGWVKVA